jgi:hypothetical protein
MGDRINIRGCEDERAKFSERIGKGNE